MKRKFVVLSILLVLFLGIYTGCGSSFSNKITDKKTQQQIEKAISNGIKSGQYKKLTNILDKYKNKGINLSEYKDNNDFSEFIISKFSDLNSIDSTIELLNILEQYQYKNNRYVVHFGG